MFCFYAPSPTILVTSRISDFCEVFSKTIELKFNGILLSLMISRQVITHNFHVFFFFLRQTTIFIYTRMNGAEQS